MTSSSKTIHPSAIIGPNVRLADNVEIGPYSVISGNVSIGEGTVIKSHVVIEGNVSIGVKNVIYPFSTIGVAPQDLKFAGEDSRVEIGDNNTIREHVTIHAGTKDGAMLTKMGSNCLIMVGCHLAHDCVLGDHVILANNATLAGHVEVGNYVVIGGLSAVHQFARIGNGAMIGGMSGVEGDVIPHGLVMGERASLAGLNLVGMKRRGVDRKDIHALRNFFKKLFENQDASFADRVELLSQEFSSELVQEVIQFVKSESSRSFCQLKQ